MKKIHLVFDLTRCSNKTIHPEHAVFTQIYKRCSVWQRTEILGYIFFMEAHNLPWVKYNVGITEQW